QAERKAQHRLYEAKLAQARASRWSGRVGQRFDSLRALTEAAQLAQELGLGPEHLFELPNEAVACLALCDVRPSKEWDGWTEPFDAAVAFSPDFQTYARSDARGRVSVRRVAGDSEVASLAAPAFHQKGGDQEGYPHFSPCGRYLAVF